MIIVVFLALGYGIVNNYFGWHASCFKDWATGKGSLLSTVTLTQSFTIGFGSISFSPTSPVCVLGIGEIDYYHNDNSMMDFLVDKSGCTSTDVTVQVTVADSLEMRRITVTWAATTHPRILLGHHQIPTSHAF
jgi:hypothetical protein